MHWEPGWNGIGNQDGMEGNQDGMESGMHWKPGWNGGWNALITRMEWRVECIGNQDGMHSKPGMGTH